MDGLSIVTGIAMTVFLLFYLAFNIEKNHPFLRILTIFAGVFTLLLIPSITLNLENDCSILSDGTYNCYDSGGSVVTPTESTVGTQFLSAYLWYIRIFVAYLFVYYGYTALEWLKHSFKQKK